ncbi:alpha/beta hydrolase [Synoicihabitans lomoniglobus]|uniref:Alpha/beta hydrolase n=1 Tax=Synoicihabitans lomoniglobus TaxID=2909285 RepID=A0AAF0CPT6_9BACT|nr:alpha/beta hydrolase [Opitutaceae bacterium LMO-M01]WED65829.1 alpha/beta hydrolase [Opitutaceae bacterium LMO-M01]
MKSLFVLLLLGLSLAAAPTDPVRLWPGTAPDDPAGIPAEVTETSPADPAHHIWEVTRVTNVTVPTITFHPAPAATNTGTAVIVCPGGGYARLAMDKEGTEICAWLNSLGITGIVLKYRVPEREGFERHELPLQDAQRAMGLVRARAGEFGIDPARIGIMGFSAGAHLSAVLSNNHERRTYDPIDAADDLSCRPAFAMIIYPGYLRRGEHGVSPEVAPAADKTCPTFIVQTQDDHANVENSINYYAALQAAEVPTTMHLYPSGGHGYGLRAIGQRVTDWPQRAAEWLDDLGYRHPAPARR